MALAIALLSGRLFAGYVVEWTAPLSGCRYWGYPLTQVGRGTLRTDVDGDSISDVLIFDTASVRIYSGVNHNLIWTIQTPGYEPGNHWAQYPCIKSLSYVANTDADPANELVLPVCTWDEVGSRFFIYDCQTHAQEYVSEEDTLMSQVEVEDIDGDARCEILFARVRLGLLEVYGWSGGGIAGEPATGNNPTSVSARPSVTNRAVSIEIPHGLKTDVELGIIAVTGRTVKRIRLSSGAGIHTVCWDCRDDAGKPVPAGKYFYRAGQTTGQVEVVK
jgi:hypothetical protein